MPNYHFNTQDGVRINDAEGIELPDLATAKLEAARLAGLMLVDDPGVFWRDAGWEIQVTDDAGLVLLSIMICGYASPATLSH